MFVGWSEIANGKVKNMSPATSSIAAAIKTTMCSTFAIWREDDYTLAFKAIEAALPTNRVVYEKGRLGLPGVRRGLDGGIHQ